MNRHSAVYECLWVLVGLGSLLCGIETGKAQGSVQFITTGGGLPLVAVNQSFPAVAAINEPRLVFNFGFGTDEPFQEGVIFDSFTARLQTASQSHVLTVVTADRTGVFLTPETPGGVVLPPGAVVPMLIAFPDLQPLLAFTNAVNLQLPIPSAMAGQPLELTFELFDNLNNVRSVGVFWDAQIILIPEPSAIALFGLGGLFVWIRRKQSCS